MAAKKTTADGHNVPEGMKEYQLVRGTHDWRDPETNVIHTFVKDDMVPLTEDQFKNFRDKFVDPNDMPKKRAAPGPVEPPPSRAQTEPADNAQLRLNEEEVLRDTALKETTLSSEPTTPGLVGKEAAQHEKKGETSGGAPKGTVTGEAKATDKK